jgi:hypothetical protein
MYLVDIGLGDFKFFGLDQDRNKWSAVVNAVMNFRVPYNAGKQSSG